MLDYLLCESFQKVFFLFTVLFGILALLIIKFQDLIVYVPSFGDMLMRSMNANSFGYRTPLDRGLPYKDVYIKSGKDTLHGWLIYPAKGDKEGKEGSQMVNDLPTVVFFHENAGNIGIRLGYLEAYIMRVECNVLIVGYRGYSHSEGQPSEKNLQQDSLAILDYVFDKQSSFDREKVTLHGRPLAAAVNVR